MKILHIILTMNPKFGGPAQGIRNYEYAFIHQPNIKRTVLCFDNPNEGLQWGAYNLNLICLGEVKNRWMFHPKFKNWLKTNIVDYDVILINGMWSYQNYATISIKNELENKGIIVPPIYIMPHGMLDPWFQQDKSRRFKSIRNSIYWHLVEKKVVNSVNGLLFTCEEELILARNVFKGYNPKQSINIGYGIAPPPFLNSEMTLAFNNALNCNISKPYFLYLSRIDPKKGLDLLFEAYLKILTFRSESINSIELPVLVIAGPGLDNAYGKQLLAFLKKNPILEKYIYFTGMLLGDAKWGAIYGCEAFILPSHQENFGIAIVESLSCGKPVLVSNKVNIFREIVSFEAGIIEKDDLDGTYNLLNKFLLMSVDERKKMSLQAQKLYREHFDIIKVANNLKSALSQK